MKVNTQTANGELIDSFQVGSIDTNIQEYTGGNPPFIYSIAIHNNNDLRRIAYGLGNGTVLMLSDNKGKRKSDVVSEWQSTRLLGLHRHAITHLEMRDSLLISGSMDGTLKATEIVDTVADKTEPVVNRKERRLRDKQEKKSSKSAHKGNVENEEDLIKTELKYEIDLREMLNDPELQVSTFTSAYLNENRIFVACHFAKSEFGSDKCSGNIFEVDLRR